MVIGKEDIFMEVVYGEKWGFPEFWDSSKVRHCIPALSAHHWHFTASRTAQIENTDSLVWRGTTESRRLKFCQHFPGQESWRWLWAGSGILPLTSAQEALLSTRELPVTEIKSKLCLDSENVWEVVAQWERPGAKWAQSEAIPLALLMKMIDVNAPWCGKKKVEWNPSLKFSHLWRCPKALRWLWTSLCW